MASLPKDLEAIRPYKVVLAIVRDAIEQDLTEVDLSLSEFNTYRLHLREELGIRKLEFFNEKALITMPSDWHEGLAGSMSATFSGLSSDPDIERHLAKTLSFLSGGGAFRIVLPYSRFAVEADASLFIGDVPLTLAEVSINDRGGINLYQKLEDVIWQTPTIMAIAISIIEVTPYTSPPFPFVPGEPEWTPVEPKKNGVIHDQVYASPDGRTHRFCSRRTIAVKLFRKRFINEGIEVELTHESLKTLYDYTVAMEAGNVTPALDFPEMAVIDAAYMAEMMVVAVNHGAPANLFGDKPIFNWGKIFHSIRYANEDTAQKRYESWKMRTDIIPAAPIFVPINLGMPPVAH